MRQSTSIIVLAVFVAHVYSAPQLISFKDGKIGVNFAGYHAAAGLGGLLGNGASGGLFAEAGTPFGQSARAGLGGAVDGSGGTSGGLYAGATAGGNVKASTGLAGGVTAEKTAGTGYASAQAGDRFASTGLGGEASGAGASGFTFSGSKSFGVSSGTVKEVEVVQPVQPIEVVKPVHKEVHFDAKFDAANEVKPLPLSEKPEIESRAAVSADYNVQAQAPAAVVVKEIHVQPPPETVEKQIYYTRLRKPHRHHFRKTAFIGGYVGAGGDVAPPPPPPPPAPVVYKTYQPVIQKRVDVGVESGVSAGGSAHADVGGTGGGQIGYTKQVTFQRNPNFFADIFNIPISTLKAVGNFLGNAAGSTSVSIQKSASLQAGAEKDLTSEHVASSPSKSSEATISVQTPNASKFIDDILAIPINTLGAVNKFLENNVPARKTVQVSPEDGHRGRRRANKRVVVVQENSEPAATETKPESSA